MRRCTLALAFTVLALTIGCGANVTAPQPAQQLRPATTPTADDVTDDGTNPDGTCRSGYSMTSGRCTRI